MLKQTFLFVAFLLCTLAFVGAAEHLFSPTFEQCVSDAAKNKGSSLKGVGKSEFGGGSAVAQGGSRLA